MNMRTYQQTARAEAAAERTERIMAAALELFLERPYDQITLADVASRAGVGLQTLIRRVGSKEGLVVAVNEWVMPRVAREHAEPVNDAAAVAERTAAHNERWGDLIMRTLQQADRVPALAANAEAGRRAHHDWIVAAFGTALAGCAPAKRRQLVARLAAVTSTEFWMVLRRDEGLSPAEAAAAVKDLIDATLALAPSTGATR